MARTSAQRDGKPTLQRYRDFRPTQWDAKGLACDDRQDWFVAPVSQTRDSGCLDRSNFRSCLKALGGESETVEVHRFGHWGPGWFEIILVKPESEAYQKAEEIMDGLANYPVVNDLDFSELEMEEANEVWTNCYNDRERLEYMREHREQFEPHDFRELWACAKGRYFIGYASELIDG